MREVAKYEKEELAKVFQNVAIKRKTSPAIIEKDYWVCWMLDLLFNRSFLVHHIVFKGGTSLSKCFELIERFSEDIDIILDWRLLGYSKEEPLKERSHTKQDAFNKEFKEKTEKYLSEVIVPILNKHLKDELGEEYYCKIEEDNKNVISFNYNAMFNSESIIPYVRLEIGVLASWKCEDIGIISPYIADEYPDIFSNLMTSVLVVYPEKTFWEKLTILHREANRPIDKKPPDRYSRHYYDVYCISKSYAREKVLREYKLLDDVVKFKEKFYRCPWAKYEDATLDKIKLLPPSYNLEFFKRDYEQMKEMIYGEAPEFDEILSGLKDLEEEIHNLAKNQNSNYEYELSYDKVKSKYDGPEYC